MFHKPMILRHFLPKQDLPAGTNWLSVALDFSHPSKNEKKKHTDTLIPRHQWSILHATRTSIYHHQKIHYIYSQRILHEYYVRD